ncbi:MAG: GntP family permease [Verrucomicrobiae bacterium]|nr:GntP family permease [Verrucomicrobiae bacterium]MCB1090881.1 GntP family permease [Verrucomicrobiae bacterium]
MRIEGDSTGSGLRVNRVESARETGANAPKTRLARGAGFRYSSTSLVAKFLSIPPVLSPFLLLAIGMAVVIGGILALRLHAFVALLLAALTVAALTPVAPDAPPAVERVAAGLGKGFSSLAILISMAAIIGKCLLESGGAERIVLSLRRGFGEKGTPAAFALSGFTLGIPVFFDTVFYLLMPLGKALRMQTGKNYLLYILAIVCGATMAHSLVPPTPGPLLVAGELKVDIGVMMIGGLAVGSITVVSGYLYALWANRRWEIPLRPSAELSEEDLAAMSSRDEKALPPFWASLLPILLPVLLVGGQSVSKALGHPMRFFEIAGEKNLALVISAAVAMALLAVAKRKSLGELSDSVGAALASGGVILLITSAGSAFGSTLKDTGIADAVAALLPAGQSLVLIVVAYLITAAVRTAQGSATVAMITSVGIVAPIAATVSLGFHPVYLALAIGCGSKPVMWANDSGFWIIGRMSGMNPMETFKTASVQMLVMSATGLAAVLLGAALFPMAG